MHQLLSKVNLLRNDVLFFLCELLVYGCFLWGIVEQMKLNNIFLFSSHEVGITFFVSHVMFSGCVVCFTYVLNTKYVCRWLDIQAVFQEDIFMYIYIYIQICL